MANSNVNLFLNGFILEGCWKTLAAERPHIQKTRKRSGVGHIERALRGNQKPKKWEFTDYPEEQYERIVKRMNRKRRVG